ncbi:unnamed protein product, partial [Closterium sp. Naga37s-1]
ACGNKCGTDAKCVVAADGTGACECMDGSTFNNLDNTCGGVVADACGNKCGTDAKCVVAADGTGACECMDGSTFNNLDNTCGGVVVATGSMPAAPATGSTGDACANKECGADAECFVNNIGAGVCQCKDGSTFNNLSNTCNGVVDACDNNCGSDAACVEATGECECFDGSTFNNADNTCDGVVDPCASSDCGGNGGVCQVNNGDPECVCTNGLVFNEFDMSCYAPFLQTTVQLQLQAQVNGRQSSYAEKVNFTTNGPAEQLSGTTVCTDLTSSLSLRGDTRISVGWSSFQSSGKGNGMCKSVSFHSNPGCTDKAGLTIARPAKDGRSYRTTERTVEATDLPRSVGCEITTCHKDCGDAECVVKDGKHQCQCPWGSVFNEAQKSCDKTNPDRCAGKDCGRNGGVCQVIDGVPECVCFHGLLFDEFDQTCYAPFLQTTVQLQLQAQVNGRQSSYAEKVNFTTNGPAEQLSGTTVCTNLTSSLSLRGDTRISVGWSSFQSSGKGNGMCKSVSFHSNPGCTGKAGLTIARPAKDGGSYRNSERTVKATDLPRSVGCEMTTCHKDCGDAECVVKDRKPRCECPWSLVFNEAEKSCRNDTRPPANDPCKTGTVRCDRNATCVVKNGQGMCQCKAGYTNTSGVCTANDPCKTGAVRCDRNSKCIVKNGQGMCQCKAGYTKTSGVCTANDPCKTGAVRCDRNSKCVVKNGQGMCQCKAGYTKTSGVCTANDPCKTGAVRCDRNSKCVVKNGQGMCQCKAGYTKTSGVCTANDPCKTGAVRCDRNSKCVVKNGQGMCQCKAGYTKTSGVCTANDPCKTGAVRCDRNSKCVVKNGLGMCQCKAGYTKTSGICTAIPVCSPACPANGRCTMVHETAQCQCNSGYKMDKSKKQCT